MSEFIEELKDEHQAIYDYLSDIVKGEVDESEFSVKMLSFEDFIISHLLKEDENIYYPIFQLGDEHPYLQKDIQKIAHTQEEVTKEVINFFNLYYMSISENPEDSTFDPMFAFKRIYAKLKARAEQEEKFIFNIYDTIIAKTD
jgi:hypothetical protein